MSIDTVIVPFPDQHANPEKKRSKEYGLAISDAMIASWRQGRNLWAYDQIQPNGYFDLMQQYLEGRQDPSVYQKRYYGTDKDGAVRKGYNNISFEVHDEVRKHRSTIQKIVTDKDFATRITSNTKAATNKKLYEKFRLWYDTQANSLREAAGVPKKDFVWIPETRPELEQYAKLGGFKLPLESAMTEAAKHIFESSNWDYKLIRFLDETLSTGHAVAYIKDSNDGSTCFDFIRVRDYDSSYIDDEDIDPPYAGHYEYMRLEELVPKLKRDYPGITEEDIQKIAKSGLGLTQNRGYNTTNYINRDPVTQRWAYYDMMVRVYRFHYKSIDTDYYISDGIKYYKGEWGKEINKGTKKTETTQNYQIYSGIRVVGWNYVVDYGPMANLVFNQKGEPVMPYAHVWTGEQSIVQGWKPIIDEIQMIVLKMRAATQQMKGDRTVYDIGIMAQMDFGAGILKPTEVVRYAEETNRMFVQTRGDAIGKIDTSKAIYNVPGANKDFLPVLQDAKNYWSLQMMEVAGITPAMSASGQQPDLVGLMQNEINQTNNAMFILIKCMARLRKKITQLSVSKVIRNVEYVERSRQYWSGVIGEQAVQALRNAQDQSTNQIGINFIAKPDPLMKQNLINGAMESMKAGKNGMPNGIATSDYYAVLDQIENGSLEMAVWLLSVAEGRNARQLAQERSAAAQETFKGQAESAQSAEEGKRKTASFMAQLQQAIKKAEIFDQLTADMREKEQLALQKIKEIVTYKSHDNANSKKVA